MNKYILAVDQSTQGTKAAIFDEKGSLVCRADRAHEQIINEKGYISHDLNEIYAALLNAVKEVVEKSGVGKENIVAAAITNQRETSLIFDENGPLDNAIVWHCSRGKEISDTLEEYAQLVYEKSGLPLSPFFPAAKMAWLIKHVKHGEKFFLSTVDAYLIYKLTGNFVTDYSNAARYQLFNIHTLEWDEQLCSIFNVPLCALPKIVDSDSDFGYTDFEGIFDKKIPIKAVMGDSNAALYAHSCFNVGDVKATYGTGSSIMMNIGSEFKKSESKLATSLAWSINSKADYVLEGNINYSAAIMRYLEKIGIIDSAKESSRLAFEASKEDETVFVPAFSGLSAPHWANDTKALICGMGPNTGRAEITKAALESIALQINDVLKAMEKDSGLKISTLHVDGGAVGNEFLMQFQSDIANIDIYAPEKAEFSLKGVALLALRSMNMLKEDEDGEVKHYTPGADREYCKIKQERWERAVEAVKKGIV